MRRLSQREAWAVVIVNFVVCGAAMLVCLFLSIWMGEWLMYAWFIGAAAFTGWNFYGNSLPTYILIGAAIAAVAYFVFWHPISPS